MLRLRTFGGLSLELPGGRPGGAAAQPRRLAILAVLATSGGQGVSRDRLLALLWPEDSATRARQALSQSLYALRRDTGADDLILGVGTERLALNPTAVSADVSEFEALVAGGALEAAAALYTGPFLDGVHLTGDAGEFERWVDEQRVRLAEVAETALETLATTAQRRADHEAAARWWRRLTSLDPLRTRATAGLMHALVASADRAGALRQAQIYVRRVREDLEAAPSQEIVELANRIRAEGADAEPESSERYELVRELGRGGMAVVMLAHDTKHDRQVALKILHAELTAAIDRQRMLREIAVTARLQHPHILPLHDSGEMDGRLFYVSPYVAGESLRARLQREGPLPVAEAVRLAVEIAEALEHAHRSGVVHRDIKPENVLLTEAHEGMASHAIVADFGIVHLLTDAMTERLTMPHLVLGTPTYMSPEQIAGEETIDGRSDVFALGCVFYEMLAGRPPWIGANIRAILANRFTDRPPSLHTLRAEVPPEVSAAVERALALEPADRHQTAAAFGQALIALGRSSGHVALAAVPRPSGVLVGRDRERSAALGLLLRTEVRLLTLTGTGGTGKTALALQIAADAESVVELTGFVDLAPVRDPAQVLPSIAAAVGARDREDRPILDAVAAALGSRSTLLVIDNFEQVVAAAADIARLIALTPGLKILVTSRVPLRVRGEHEFFVAPLEVPESPGAEPAVLREAAAVELFVRRAREARHDLQFDDDAILVTAEICRRLDGLPLAIELAAARARLLPLPALHRRLEERRLDVLTEGARDLPTRHRTLRAAIQWSYELLGDVTRQAFPRLSVFAGPFDLSAMAATVDMTVDAATGLADELLAESLVRRAGEDASGPRLALLETIREFALEQLRRSGEEAVARDRHLAHFLAIAERVAPDLNGSRQADALAELDRHAANLRAAMEWATGLEDRAPLTRLVLALWRAWLVRGQWTEGRAWLARAVERGAPSAHLQAEAHGAAAALAQNQGDYDTAYIAAKEALDLWRGLGERAGEARALATMGWLAWRRCRYSEGRALSMESFELHRELGDQRGAAQALNNIGWIALFEGKVGEAVQVLERTLAIRRGLGDHRGVAFALTTLAWAADRGGDHVLAERHLREALQLFETIGERQLYAFAQRVGAEMALGHGDAAAAERALEEISVPIFREIGDRWGLCVALGVLGDALLAQGQLDRAAAAYRESASIAHGLDDGYSVASALARESLLALAVGDGEHARAMRKAAERAMTAVGGTFAPWLRERLEQTLGAESAVGGE